MEHITIEEMLSFLQIDELTPANIKKANSFNQHIYQCSECRKIYSDLCEAVETIEEATNRNNENIRILQACFKTSKESYTEIISKFTKKIRDLATEITVEIESLTKITTTNLLSGFSFYHPVPVGQLKSMGEKSKDEALDILIDDKYNRISVSQDGTLSLRFQKDVCREDQMVFLIPEDEEQDVLIAYSKMGADGLVRVEFYDLMPGNYKIKI